MRRYRRVSKRLDLKGLHIDNHDFDIMEALMLMEPREECIEEIKIDEEKSQI